MSEEDNKKPWINYPEIWGSESKFLAFIRGGIRKSIWNRYPIKLEYMKNNRKKIKNPNPKGRVKEVWGGTCYLCRQDFVSNNLQVDHVKGNHRFTSMGDLQTYTEALLFITEDDLEFVCKNCHSIKSHAERYNMTFDEAKVAKNVIAFGKKPLTEQLKVLKSVGVIPEKETKIACKKSYQDYLKTD